MNNDLISRAALWQKVISHIYPVDILENEHKVITEILRLIDNAPTVDTTCPHCDSGYAQGYSDGYLRGKEERPQGDLAEKLNDRIEKSVCRYCQMNKHCELCEISRVFSIIALTDKEMKGGEKA